MVSFIAILKKEALEAWRTHKIIILAAVAVILAVMSVLLAKLTPEILRSLTANDEMIGIAFEIPDPTAWDSWTQFFGNVGQLGMMAVIIVFGGIMANELKHGTLINLLTKGVQRVTIILAKFVSASALWTLTYAICICVNAGYTAYYFETVSMEHALLSFAALWLFGEFLIAVAIFAGTLFKSFIGALLTSLLLAFTMSILTINPDFDRYNPITLCAKNMQLLQGFSSADDVTVVIVCMCITAGAVIVMIAGAIAVFSKQQV